MYGNCLVFALLARLMNGGRIVFVRSNYGWWSHFYWVDQNGDIFEYVPVRPHRQVKRLWHPLPPMIYGGKVRRAPMVPKKVMDVLQRPKYAKQYPHLQPVEQTPV